MIVISTRRANTIRPLNLAGKFEFGCELDQPMRFVVDKNVRKYLLLSHM
jgi:hypothetical protein